MNDLENNKTKDKYLMYMHAGSGNHGCEAIVRGISESMKGVSPDSELTLVSYKAGEDKKYGLDDICCVTAARQVEEHFLPHLYFYGIKKLTGHGESRMKYIYKNAGDFSDYKYAISIGGDNYCYDETIYDLKMANSMFYGKGVRTALIGCSIEPELMKRRDIVEDMKRYSVIIARESLTYTALRRALGYNTEEALEKAEKEEGRLIKLIPDPAFNMKPQACALPEGFEAGKTIGINVSPLILGYENKDDPGITLANYEELIRTIIEETDDKIALIPHVIWNGNDDREPLKKLYDKYASTGRLILVSDHSAPELKFIISNCRLFIGARTHATIAAYSSCVPTLVVGYSVKSRGIATDLFGTDENYVLPVQKLKNKNDLADAFRWLDENSIKQRKRLETVMPEYIEKASTIMEYL